MIPKLRWEKTNVVIEGGSRTTGEIISLLENGGARLEVLTEIASDPNNLREARELLIEEFGYDVGELDYLCLLDLLVAKKALIDSRENPYIEGKLYEDGSEIYELLKKADNTDYPLEIRRTLQKEGVESGAITQKIADELYDSFLKDIKNGKITEQDAIVTAKLTGKAEAIIQFYERARWSRNLRATKDQ